MKKLIISAAICGAEVTKDDNPNIPYTAAELAEEAWNAEQAGASIIHLHVRNDEGKPTQEREIFRMAIDAMMKRGVKAIIQPSTGGAAGMSLEERIQPLELHPEMATLDCGTLNFGDTIFVNDLPLMRNIALIMEKRGIMPELECFEPGHIKNALKLVKENLIPGHLHFDLVMGVPGAIGGEIHDLLYLVNLLPGDATWTVAGVGRFQLPLACHAIQMGGHVRVGFEDNIYYSRGILAENNGQLVERIVRIAGEVGREIASPDETRELLGLKSRIGSSK